MTHRLLEAPTVEITGLLQDSIENWLGENGEIRAADWLSTYWMGEHGNYTNANAGYVGSNKSAGIESHWRYTKRDTIGGAGSNKRISLSVFIPSLVQYVKDSSKRHTSKILCSTTGAHRFPSAPSIGTTLWGKIQQFKLIRLLLSVSEGNSANEKLWQDELYFFHDEQFPTDAPFTELIKSYRDARKHPKIARSLLGAIIMPTNALIGKLKNTGYTEFEHLEAHVAEARAPYEVLLNKPNEFHIRDHHVRTN